VAPPSRATIRRFGNDREETRYAARSGATTTNLPTYILRSPALAGK
jgi:hypothetical protein